MQFLLTHNLPSLSHIGIDMKTPIFLFSLMIALVYFLKKTIELEAKYYHSQLLPHAVLNAMIFLQKSIN